MSENTFLTLSGLSYFLGKLKTIFQLKESGKGLSTNDFTNALKTKLEGVATGAQVNVIETVKVNGTALEVSEKAVDVTVPTKVVDLEDAADFHTVAAFNQAIANYSTTTQMNQAIEDAVDVAISTAYKAAGTVAHVADLPELVKANLGNIYNLTSSGEVTTADFVEGAGKSLAAGSNIAVIEATPEAFVPTEDTTAQEGKTYYADENGTELAEQPAVGSDISSEGYYEKVNATYKYDVLAGILEFYGIPNEDINALFVITVTNTDNSMGFTSTLLPTENVIAGTPYTISFTPTAGATVTTTPHVVIVADGATIVDEDLVENEGTYTKNVTFPSLYTNVTATYTGVAE